MLNSVRYYLNLMKIAWNRHCFYDSAHEEVQLHYSGRISDLVKETLPLAKKLGKKSRLLELLRVD